ncbi:MAG: KH domain-containing protein [Clostridia bacterium]|nr:KH domain-containing protein [Clostridia bacterium]
MTDLKQTLHNIAAAIVDDPDSVVVTVNETETTVNLTLSVAPDDMGMVIGKGGRIAKAIRMVIKAAAADCPKKVNVDIR